MAFWSEITGVGHARRCITKWYGNIPDIDKYAAMAWFLTSESAFVSALEDVSKRVWEQYVAITDGSNRLTRAIQQVGRGCGFRCYLADPGLPHVVYVDQLTKETFLSNVSGRVLWKDSFGFGHGEFSHSYQWLAAGSIFGADTARLYAGCVVESNSELFYLENGRVRRARVPLWQWLVDSIGLREAEVQPIGWGDDHANYGGHCFSASYRFANAVQSLLVSKSDWFIGWYANHRNQRLDSVVDRTKKVLKRELADAGYSSKDIKTKLNNIGQVQRIGISDKYGGAVVNGVYESSFKLAGDKKQGWTPMTFHGIPGRVPAA